MASKRKLLQILYKIQNDSLGKDIMYFLKMLYFADRYHLRHYGTTASDDVYFAMQKGPVASAAFDILRGSNVVVPTSEYTVEIPTQENDELSQSVLESIDFALKTFGKYNCGELSDISQKYPEWDRCPQKSQWAKMNFKDFFDDPENFDWLKNYHLNEDPFKDDKEFLKLLQEDL